LKCFYLIGKKLNLNKNILDMKFSIYPLYLLIVFLAWGCQTPGYYISDSNLIIPETRKAITAIIGKPQMVSLNGRELISEYHDSKFKMVSPDEQPKVRYFTKVSILGARRPYEINIQVTRQDFEAETLAYIDTELDEGLTEKRAKEIKKALNYSLEKQQRFDGDNPF
jgi:hypothetical protein